MGKYRVAYVTGTRADFGIVRRYLSLLSLDSEIDFSILVTGAHLEKSLGYTVKDIRADGFFVEREFPISINTDTTSSVIRSMALALSSFGEHFEKNKYDLVILLGDRYEIMAASIAAAMQKIRVLHLHGGEMTLGNYDEFIRHSITKMSSFHFTSTEEYRKRVIQLGESPDRVFYMGALGAENCRNIDVSLVDERILSLPRKKYFTVVYHPETLTGADIGEEAKKIVAVMSSLMPEYQTVFIGSNADTGAHIISEIFKCAAENENFLYFDSLSSDSYLYLVRNSVALIGNSSSGIIEAPSLDTYTVNIGRRQDGRIRADSVIDIECDESEIREALERVISLYLSGKKIENPYYKESCAENYYAKTKEILKVSDPEPKTFYDVKFDC